LPTKPEEKKIDIPAYLSPASIEADVQQALQEDIGEGDITAQLIPADTEASARVIARESASIAGRPWVDEVFKQVAKEAIPAWQVQEGEQVLADTILFTVTGNARQLLTAERCALNYLQVLSATATAAHRYAQLIQHTQCKVLDTRKTLPGLRCAQKYAVLCGGGNNHRIGLWDAYLIKENHIAACGSIRAAVKTAKQLHPGKAVEVEVERLEQLQEAISVGADIVMLDNFELETMRTAVKLTAGRLKLEASGGIDDSSIVAIAETGVDFISIGAITKHCRAVDLSMRFF